MAIFETDKDIAIEFDISDSDWTVILVKDKNTGVILITSNEPYSDDDE